MRGGFGLSMEMWFTHRGRLVGMVHLADEGTVLHGLHFILHIRALAYVSIRWT